MFAGQIFPFSDSSVRSHFGSKVASPRALKPYMDWDWLELIFGLGNQFLASSFWTASVTALTSASGASLAAGIALGAACVCSGVVCCAAGFTCGYFLGRFSSGSPLLFAYPTQPVAAVEGVGRRRLRGYVHEP